MDRAPQFKLYPFSTQVPRRQTSPILSGKITPAGSSKPCLLWCRGWNPEGAFFYGRAGEDSEWKCVSGRAVYSLTRVLALRVGGSLDEDAWGVHTGLRFYPP